MMLRFQGELSMMLWLQGERGDLCRGAGAGGQELDPRVEVSPAVADLDPGRLRLHTGVGWKGLF